MGKSKRLNFGVMASTLNDKCQSELLDGISDFAKEHDIHLTVYIGTFQTIHDDFDSQYETCFYAMQNNSSLDGSIIITGFIEHDTGAEKFKEYFARLPEDMPLVSVSSIIEGVPSVLADNESGIFDAVDHLIKVHGKKKIAFIKGPDGHTEAEERLKGYLKALDANGLDFDDNYVFHGDFARKSGNDAVVEFLDKRKLPVDAFVASDDEAAFGVLDELNSRNIYVPAEIAVTGFDDDIRSASFIPSISTAKQDFYQIGKNSAEVLYDRIKGKQVKPVSYVPPVFMARQSCGCLENDFSITISEACDTSSGEASFLSFVISRFTPLFRDILPKKQVDEWATAIVNAILKKPFSNSDFLYLFDEILVKYNHYSNNFHLWNDALNILTAGIGLYGDDIDSSHSILSTLIHATTLVHDIGLKDEKTRGFIENDFRVTLRRITSSIVLLFDIDFLAKEIYESLPILSIRTAFIGLYQKPIRTDDFDADRSIGTLIGFDENKNFNVRSNECNKLLYTDYSIIDEFNYERKRRTLFFFPLFFENEEMGILLLSYDNKMYMDVYESLRISVSAAIKGSQLLNKVQTLSITDDLTGLLNRRGFFQLALSKLHTMSRSSDVIPVLLLIDMDGLKNINDAYGHNEGDNALSTFADILKNTLRQDDIIGRLGGDEFVVFSTVRPTSTGETPVKRIRDEMEKYNNKKQHPYDISACIGSVVLADSTTECFEAAMLSADSVLYEEKTEKRKKGLTRR